MAAPTFDHHEPDTLGAALLPIFTLALLLAVVAIAVVGLVPTFLTLGLAMFTLLALAVGVIYVLARLIGPEE